MTSRLATLILKAILFDASEQRVRHSARCSLYRRTSVGGVDDAADDVYVATVDELVQNFRDALLALRPIAARRSVLAMGRCTGTGRGLLKRVSTRS